MDDCHFFLNLLINDRHFAYIIFFNKTMIHGQGFEKAFNPYVYM